MMRHFRQIKAQHPDAIVLYRMGDFYELFLADAELAAPLLDITLTSRDKGKAEPIPMCGFPVHSAEAYIKRLAELGHCVAICEQVEDPKAADGKRLVRREVVEVVSPGLVGDPTGLDGTREIALVALALPDTAPGSAGAFGIAALDATTGDFRATSVAQDPETASGPAMLPDVACEELERIAPREVLVADVDLPRLRPLLSRLLPDALLTQVPASSYQPAGAAARSAGV